MRWHFRRIFPVLCQPAASFAPSEGAFPHPSPRQGHGSLWRAVDHERELLESFVTKTRDKKGELKFLKKSPICHGRAEELVTDRLRSYGAARNELGIRDRQESGRWKNNLAENSHLLFRGRERGMLRFRRQQGLPNFASVHTSVFNCFNQERHLCSRQNSNATWR